MARKAYIQPDTADTIITQDIRIKGDIVSDNDIWIDGHIEGNVQTSAYLRIGVNGRILGNVSAQDVRVAGRIEGDIAAQQSISCDDSAHVIGRLQSRELEVARGAFISGDVQMQDGEDPSSDNEE